MPEFLVKFTVRQPDTVDNRELFEIWKREAAAALGAVEAGAVTNLWKVAGQRIVFAVVDLPTAEDLDRALAGLPIVRELGSGVTTEAWPIYAYKTFADDMNAGVYSG